jgi:lipoyl-dependent peroxiredoxin
MTERRAEATWQGGLRDGHGRMTAASGAFESSYSFATCSGEQSGTNPEELLGAAHASCYAMALAAAIEKRGQLARSIHTCARVCIEPVGGGWFHITSIDLETEGDVPDMYLEDFLDAAEEAFLSCPLSHTLRGGAVELSQRSVLVTAVRAGAGAAEPRAD